MGLKTRRLGLGKDKGNQGGSSKKDPTGAGDALTAAVLFGLLNDMPIDDAVRLGVAAASLTLTYRGSVIPDLSLEKLYDQLG